MKSKIFGIFLILISFNLHALECATDMLDVPQAPQAFFKSTVYRGKTWATGQTLHVHFLNGSKIDHWWVRLYSKRWMKYANIKFKYFSHAPKDGEQTHIRISFKEKGNWSYIGTDNRGIDKSKPTMNLSDVGKWYMPWFRKRRVVLHEFGHALGLAHEHKSPAFPYTWDEEEVLKDCRRSGWTDRQCRGNILNTLTPAEAMFWDFDNRSIMLYSFSKKMTVERKKLSGKTKLSSEDKRRIATIYP